MQPSIQTEDESLIALFRDGDQSALTTLVERYLDSVYNFAYRFVRGDAEAEDVTQETFIKVWKSIDRYKTGMNFKAWLLQIARNTAIDYIRKKKMPAISFFDTPSGDNVLLDTVSDDSLSSLEMAINTEDAALLERAIASLSPQYAEVITLRYNEELTFEEVGQVLGKPLNTVKSQARRALAELREYLEANTAPKQHILSYIV